MVQRVEELLDVCVYYMAEAPTGLLPDGIQCLLLAEPGPVFVDLKIVASGPQDRDYSRIHGPHVRKAFREALDRLINTIDDVLKYQVMR